MSRSMSLMLLRRAFHRLSLLFLTGVACGLVLSPLACKDLIGSPGLPAGTSNPSVYNTNVGALGMRVDALYNFASELPSYVVNTGLLADELESNQVDASPGVLGTSGLPPGGSLDERILPELSGASSGGVTDQDYAALQSVRARVNQAVGAIAAYGTDAPLDSVLRGELYAIAGYAELMLADFYCSGVPLSTFDFHRDYTYQPSSTTAQVYHDAIAKFDTALLLATDSARILNLARVGRGRAYVLLAQYDSAARAVAAVPGDYQYQVAVQWANNRFPNALNNSATVSDLEGINGLPYLSSGDPRTAVDTVGTSQFGVPLTFPVKYQPSGYSPFILADGIEASLVRAEAILHGSSVPHSATIDTLNALRTTRGLSPLADPQTDSGRVRVLFQERAYWLFLTGHRQSDLRRLIRDYGPVYPQFQHQDQVYPTGAYTAPGIGRYGSDVTAPIAPEEAANPLFHGCLNRGA